MILEKDKQAFAIRGPTHLIGRAGEIWRKLANIRAIRIHQIELVLLVGFQLVIVSAEGDRLAIGRGERRVVWAIAAGQRRYGEIRQFDCIDLAFDRVHVAVIGKIARDEQRVIVQPGCAAHVGFALGNLARRAAFSGQDEHLVRAILEISLAIKPERQIVDDIDRVRPFRALGLFGRGREAGLFAGYEHGEGDALAIG